MSKEYCGDPNCGLCSPVEPSEHHSEIPVGMIELYQNIDDLIKAVNTLAVKLAPYLHNEVNQTNPDEDLGRVPRSDFGGQVKYAGSLIAEQAHALNEILSRLET